MKRKYLSALLMGTLTVASMSTFTSCKDYDDDISNLQGQIDKLASADELKQKVSELQALISANQSGISSLQSELAKKTTLDEVKAVLANYAEKKYVDDADKTLNDAIEALKTGDIAQLKKDVQAAADAAKKAADDATAANAEIQETLKTLATKAEVAEVEKAAKAANEAIEALKTGDIKTLQDKQAVILETLKTVATQNDLKTVADNAAAALKAAQDAQAKKNEAAEKALKDAETKLEASIKDAQKTADAAKKQAADNLASINGLATTVQNAKDALKLAKDNKATLDAVVESLGKGYSKENTVAAAITAIQAQIGTPDNKLGSLASRLAVIESTLNGAKDDDTKLGLSTKITNIENKLKDIIGQYSTMVTDVQLYRFIQGGSVEGNFHNSSLTFIQTEEQDNVFPADAKAANKQLTFQKGKYYAGEDSLLVRVSPVDAELTTSNVSLMNSQGKELDEIIDVTNVHRYNGLISRASSNTGLWVVRFKAKDLGDKFKEAAMVDPTDNNSNKILYSVAVKNTYNTTGEEKDANTRRVTSEFGVALSTTTVHPAWDFKVNGVEVENIHNRYVQTESWERTDDNVNNKKTYAQELVWLNPAKPATKAITSGNDKNAEDRKGHTSGHWWDGATDNRQGQDILAVEKGQPIKINFVTSATVKGVKGFYVTLDEKFAQESAPSELNAWNSYEYENVGYKNQPAKLFEGSTGEITIKNMNNVEGDIIGFRVYAVNYDGTLTDPDGRAFYVAVGDVKKELNLGNSKLTINSSNKFESTVELPADFSKYDFDANNYTWTVTEEDASGNTPVFGRDFTVQYLDADKATVSRLDNTVKYIKFILKEPMEFIDGATYNVTTTLTKSISSATAPVCKVNASFTKVMPDNAPAFCYRDGFTKDPEYIIPAGNSYVVGSSNKGGSFDLRNILIINNNTYWNGIDLLDDTSNGLFTFNVANGTYKWNVTDNKYDLVNAEAGWPYTLNVDNGGETSLVDNKTPRAITATFNYTGISKYQKKDGSWYTGSFPVASKSKEEIVFCSWMKTFSYDITTTKKKDTDAEGNTWLKNNTVTWKKTGSTNTATLDLNNLATKIKDVKLLPVKFPTTVTKVKFGEFLTANVLEVVPGQYGNIYTTGTGTAKNQVNPYFSASISGNTITLQQISQDAIPSSVTGGLIHFTVKDCFGNTKAIELPFKINVTGVAAKKH